MSTSESVAPVSSSSPGEEAWTILRLWEGYYGEVRVNLLRVLGIFVFYSLHLVNRHVLHVISDSVHTALTAVAAAWVLLALGIHLCLVRRILPGWLRFLTTACDLALLTLVLLVGDGPQSPMLVAYFLIVASSALRFDTQLVAVATGAAGAAYLVVLGYAHWWRSEIQVPRQEQLTVLAALVVLGIILGQVVRRVRPLLEEHARRLEEAEARGHS